MCNMTVSSNLTRKSLVMLLKIAPPLCIVWMLYACTWPFSLLFLPVAQLVANLGWLTFYAIAAAFPLWLFYATKRVHEQSDFGMPFSPWMAAVSFFVPVAQIGMPYSVMKSLLFRLEHKVESDRTLKAWWASWIALFASAVFSMAGTLLPFAGLPYQIETLWLYGSATIFCLLSLRLVNRVESALSGAPAHSNADVPWYQQATSGNTAKPKQPLIAHTPVEEGVVLKFAKAAREKIGRQRL